MPQYRLKSRQRPLPGGYGFFDVGTNYRAGQYEDFEAQCQGVFNARMGNPVMCKRYRLTTDMEGIRNEVDAQWAEWAADHGWTDFFVTLARTDGGASEQTPFPGPNRVSSRGVSRVAAVAAGSRTIYEWINSPQEGVAKDLTEIRALTCVDCPKNEKGNLLDYFEEAAAKAITFEMERRKGWDLSTSQDDKLGVCQVCFCVNALSVHCPRDLKLKHMPTEIYEGLPENCWVKTESKS